MELGHLTQPAWAISGKLKMVASLALDPTAALGIVPPKLFWALWATTHCQLRPHRLSILKAVLFVLASLATRPLESLEHLNLFRGNQHLSLNLLCSESRQAKRLFKQDLLQSSLNNPAKLQSSGNLSKLLLLSQNLSRLLLHSHRLSKLLLLSLSKLLHLRVPDSQQASALSSRASSRSSRLRLILSPWDRFKNHATFPLPDFFKELQPHEAPGPTLASRDQSRIALGLSRLSSLQRRTPLIPDHFQPSRPFQSEVHKSCKRPESDPARLGLSSLSTFNRASSTSWLIKQRPVEDATKFDECLIV